MIRYRCPSCGSAVDLRRVYDGRHFFRCSKCNLNHLTASGKGQPDEAYFKFLEDYDSGLVSRGPLESFLEREGLVRSSEEIARLIAKFGVTVEDVPPVVKYALLSKTSWLVTYRLFEKSEPPPGPKPEDLGIVEQLCAALREIGITRLYSFQERAIQEIVSRKNTVIVAPTGSGKTEAFATPLIPLLTKDSRAELLRSSKGYVQSLFIYPTKALSRDQLPKLRKLSDAVGLLVDVFDGDTPPSERERILANPPDLVLTNFDTLHHHMLHRTSFSRLLQTVRFIVVDEVHVYTGTFGSNVHHILKRLRRVCGGFQAVAASATIRNPKEFCESLFDMPFSVVTEEEGKRGPTHLSILFPSLESSRSLVLNLLKLLSSHGYKALVFSSSHLGAELNVFYARKQGLRIEVHRGGLLPSHRKRVENEFRSGALEALSATPTLELGINIGSVDSVVSDLTTITRLIQRTGRVGRRGQESVAFVVLRQNDPISQYYSRYPEQYFQDIDQAYVDPSNPVVSRIQLLAACLDYPVGPNEFVEYSPHIEHLVKEGLLTRRGSKLVPNYAAARAVLRNYDIRGSGEQVSIVYRGRKIGERSMPIALEELHPEAVYFLAGNRYRSFDFQFQHGRGTAQVEILPGNYPFYTRPLVEEQPSVLEIYVRKKFLGVEIAYAELSIRKTVVGYVNLRIGAEENVGTRVAFSKPIEYQFTTKGIVFRAPHPEESLRVANSEGIEEPVGSSFHATEHVLIEGTNMVTGGAGNDMGGISLGSTGLIFVYDASVGGNGATRLLFDRFEEALRRTNKILSECSCQSARGCPRCTYSYRCGNNNNFLFRLGGVEVTSRILAGKGTSLEPIPVAELRSFV